jgi:ribosome-associated toxin RatA of RatAB toxin-antitoxin module
MRAEESTVIARKPGEVFATVSRVEDFGMFSSQYRGTRVLEQGGGKVVLERRAKVAGLPVRWVSEARIEEPSRVTIRQTEGPLKGMRTEWSVEPEGEGTRVRITHEFRLGRVLRPFEGLIYRWIIRKMARTMLMSVKAHMEGRVEGK